jgi:aquaporin Z
MLEAIGAHWPEYLIEGTLLGIFMLAACVSVVVVQHPRSPVARTITCPHRRRVLIGILMGLTAVGLIYSPWGARSGAHMNPGTTLIFFVLGKVRAWDAAFYILSQFVGGLIGVILARALLGMLVSHATVNYAATVPGKRGLRAAWIAELAIAFVMMTMVLWSTNHAATAPYTGLFAGLLVASFITIEAPISGMSMNPARTLGSALLAQAFRGLWIYFTAPPLGMLAAAGLYTAAHGHVYCCKMNHSDGPCIFNCEIDRLQPRHTNLPTRSGIKRSASTP